MVMWNGRFESFVDIPWLACVQSCGGKPGCGPVLLL